MVNISRDDADNQLRNRGFVVEYRQGYSDNIKKGDVISVEPGVGSTVNKGLDRDRDRLKRPGED